MDERIVTPNKRIECVHVDQGSLPGRTWITINIFRSRTISLGAGELNRYTAFFDEDKSRAARRTLRGLRLLSASLKRQVLK